MTDLTYAQVIEVRQGCDGVWHMRSDMTHHRWMPTQFAWMEGGAVPVRTFTDVKLALLGAAGGVYRVVRVADEPYMA